MRKSFHSLLLLLVLVCGCGVPLDGVLVQGDRRIVDLTAYQVFELTNDERAKVGLPVLRWNSILAKAGEEHCQDMIDNNYFAHVSPDNTTPGDRATAAGYQWSWIGENIAAGYDTPVAVMDGWMNSPDHKENILRPEFEELGVGRAVAADGTVYWAQEFGTPIK